MEKNSTAPTLDQSTLERWVGRQDRVSDVIALQHVRLIEATLDLEPLLNEGDPLPAGWHWAFFHKAARESELGRDGHPALGGFLPPVALPRRMWAGSRLTFDGPIAIGQRITRTSTIESVTLKEGSTGKLCFVRLSHDHADDSGRQLMRETQDLVYREDPQEGAAPPRTVEPPANGWLVRTVEPTTTLLFRYSAVTFNTHRIHYDRDYCRSVERYPGLVFHGPLAATLLAGVLESDDRPLREIAFRAHSPLFDDAPVNLHRDADTAWTSAGEGGVSMRADAIYAPAD